MRKKLFAVIMSAMMMITFMPSMAFAAGPTTSDLVWTGYESATVTYTDASDNVSTYVLNATKEFTSAGLIKASFPTAVADLTANYGSTVPDTVKAKFTAGARHYFDFTGAKLKLNSGALLGTNFKTVESFENAFAFGAPNLVAVRVYKPATTPAMSGDAYEDVTIDSTGKLGSTIWTLNFDKPVYDKDSTEEQKLSVTSYLTTGTAYDYTATKPAYTGSFTYNFVLKLSKNPSLTFVKPDGTTYDVVASAGSTYETYYDGLEHKVSFNNPGDKVAVYQKLDTKTGEFKDATEMTFKDAEKTAYRFQMKKSGAETSANAWLYWTVNVKKVDIIPSVTSGTGLYKGLKYTAFDYLAWGTTDATANGKFVAALVKTNKADIEKALMAAYDIKAVVNPADESVVTVTVAKNAGFDKLWAGVKAVVGNNITLNELTPGSYTVNLGEVSNNELVACNETKTFHVKKAKKLKAKKTFQMKADYVKVAGSASYFKQSGNSKIVIAKDGTVTVKKGLKKGTYKVKIKVKALAVSLPDTKTLTIKIKK